MEANRHLGRPLQSWGAERSVARLAVLAVHGRGQTPSFMHEQSQRIDSEGIRYYAPHAFGDSWYPQPFMAPMELNEPGLSQALDALQNSIAMIEADGFSDQDMVLWGFSQGACLLSHFMVSWPTPPAGLLIFTGGFIGQGPVEPQAGRPLQGVPAVLRSTEHDPWVPPGRVQDTAEILAAMGAEVDLRISPGTEHVITDEAMTAARRLLTRASERAVQRGEAAKHPCPPTTTPPSIPNVRQVKLSAFTSSSTTIPTTLTPGTWTLDGPHSEVGFTVRHAGISKVRGSFDDVTATLRVAGTLEESLATATIAATSFNSNDVNRDAHVRSADFFDVEQFPHLTFVSTGCTGSGDTYDLHGDLTIRGITKPVTLLTEFNGVAVDAFGATRAGFSASTVISRRDFDLTWNAALEAGGVLVGDKVTIHVEVAFISPES